MLIGTLTDIFSAAKVCALMFRCTAFCIGICIVVCMIQFIRFISSNLLWVLCSHGSPSSLGLLALSSLRLLALASL